ncbi:MAG: Si-specific NAD(P)(+) transhydrogenase [Myxococcota bacterium]|nr:Si-specific NAD(P)(+) transhydrogenase [Myxococcales bacterium]
MQARAHYDALVIGAGPAGWSAALQGSKLGLRVAVAERGAVVGGNCIHWGTVPSKTLRETILKIVAVREAGAFGIRSSSSMRMSIHDLMRHKDSVIDQQTRTIQNFLDRNHVDVLPGSASFVDPHRVRVANASDEAIYRADRIFIATGSRPRRPASIPFDDRYVVDSDSILELDAVPRSLAVLGGGVIGCEYACMFAALGVKVTLIDRRRELLRFLDERIVSSLCHHMQQAGVRLLLGEDVEGIDVGGEDRSARVRIALRGGRTVKAERLLATAGRESAIASLALDAAGVAVDDQGLVKVDECYRTSTEHVYAMGDVIGFPALAGTSMHQGRVAMLHAAGREVPPPRALPIAIYTIPEISMVGLTEQECRDQGIPYEVGVARSGELARGQISGELDGLLALVFHRDDGRLLGVHMIGPRASELIHFGMALLHAGGTIDDVAGAIFNYPTSSEAYRVAALDGLNRL